MLYDYCFLQHHGIKGMKWGVRRFQNKNGSYTDEGKRRRQKPIKRLVKSGKKPVNKIVKASQNSVPAKRYSNMSDAELASRIQRKRNEITLADLEFDASLPAGVRFVKNFAYNGVTKGSTTLVSDLAYGVGKQYLKDTWDLPVGK